MLTKTSSRLVAFAATLAVVAGAAAALGNATSASPPFQDCLKVAALEAGIEKDMGGETGEHGDGEQPMVEAVPGAHGLTTELAGLEIRPEPRTFKAGATSTWRFRIVDCDGKAVTEFEPEN